jgi:hypothetical protein
MLVLSLGTSSHHYTPLGPIWYSSAVIGDVIWGTQNIELPLNEKPL